MRVGQLPMIGKIEARNVLLLNFLNQPVQHGGMERTQRLDIPEFARGDDHAVPRGRGGETEDAVRQVSRPALVNFQLQPGIKLPGLKNGSAADENQDEEKSPRQNCTRGAVWA